MFYVGQNVFGKVVLKGEDTLKEASEKKEAMQEVEKSITLYRTLF